MLLVSITKPELSRGKHSSEAIENLANLRGLYQNADVKRKRKIIGSIFPEKLFFDGFSYRTARFNETAELIFNVGKAFRKIKTGQTEENFNLSSVVPKTEFLMSWILISYNSVGSNTSAAFLACWFLDSTRLFSVSTKINFLILLIVQILKSPANRSQYVNRLLKLSNQGASSQTLALPTRL